MHSSLQVEVESVPEGVRFTFRQGPQFVRFTMTPERASRFAAEAMLAANADLADAAPIHTGIRL